MSVPYQML